MKAKSGFLKRRVCFILMAFALIIAISSQLLFLRMGVDGVDGQASLETSSFKKSPHIMIPAEEIDAKEYYVFDNSCLEPSGLNEWTVRVKTKRSILLERIISYRVFVANGDFVMHNFRVVHDRSLNMTGDGVHMRKGTYMVQSNTHANNYHVMNDFLLPAFRALLKTRINGLLIPAGCVDCWRGRLPLQSIMLHNFNLMVVYPLENATSVDAPMCFDRLIIQQSEQGPYHIRKGRFSRYWPREIFIGFRDSAHDYVRKLLQSEEVEQGAPRNKTDVAKTVGVRNVVQTSSNDKSKPVLSWMS